MKYIYVNLYTVCVHINAYVQVCVSIFTVDFYKFLHVSPVPYPLIPNMV